MTIKRALISVSDKTGIIDLAKVLHSKGVEILSTGGTAKAIREAGIEVIDVSDYTGFPEMMGGRVKSLHPKIHGGLLALRDNASHMSEAEANGIKMIDLVVVNLYPFEQTIAKEGVSEEEAIEQIDIGGPSMLRSAAKNFQSVTVVTNPEDYEELIKQIEKNGETSLEFRRNLALNVFEKTYRYDLAIANYLRENSSEKELLDFGHYQKVMSLRYGENPHQNAAFFKNPDNDGPNVTNAKVLHGKQLSFNNIIDADAALELVKEFDRPAAVFVKHNNPCGVAEGDDLQAVFEAAHQVDSLSAFGCIIALNRPFTLAMAEYMSKQKMFAELIIAPSFEADGLDRVMKRENIRLLATGPLAIDLKRRDVKKVAGGMLIQNANTYLIKKEDLKTATTAGPTEEQIEELLFAFKVCKHVKSNAIIFAKKLSNGVIATTGIGAGQMSRVDSVMIARHKGGDDNVRGSVMASDAFFPFADSIDQAHEAGITSIIQPGGSVRDDEVIAKANEFKMSMVFSGIRCFRH